MAVRLWNAVSPRRQKVRSSSPLCREVVDRRFFQMQSGT
jgi:hypothetical protein